MDGSILRIWVWAILLSEGYTETVLWSQGPVYYLFPMESVKDFPNSMDSLTYSWFQKTKLKDSQISTDPLILLISTRLLADDDENYGNHAQNGNKAFRWWLSENLENWDPLFPGAHLLALRAICTQQIQQRVSKALTLKLYTCVSISSKRLGKHKSSGPKSLAI